MAPGTGQDQDGEGLAWSRLMAAAQDGDRAAYGRLLTEIQPFIRKIAAAHHRGADRIDDVVQDVLLTLHRVRHTYDPSRRFEHWLSAIARRRSIDLLRQRGRIDTLEISDEIAYETFSDPGANRELENRHATEGLGEAIAALPEGQREAVELLKLKELSLAEASDVTGKSVASLKVAVHRALKTLRLTLRRD